MSSASWKEDNLSQDSHVLFMSLPPMYVTVNELLMRYVSLFRHLEKVKMILPAHFVKCQVLFR